jgi:hypothetical protein
MKNRMILRVEELEQRNTPSCNGLQNALTNPGADHRSDTGTEQLQDNMAVQCSGHTPGAKNGGHTTGANFKSDKTPGTLAAPLTGSGGDCDDATGNPSMKIVPAAKKIPNGPDSPTTGADDDGTDDFDGQCTQPPNGGPHVPTGLIQNHNETLVRDRRKRTKSRK